ncbi:MAG: DNA translocase FtsK 4TM domain-containing protein [Akkermansiaceae bacterium]|nr:DNA translocase FtsK 4TM domain-containing protein [Akkermansiaceae bacterium]
MLILMAKSKNRSKSGKPGESRWPKGVMGVVFVGLGLLMLLSLVTYTPGDLPMRVPGVGWMWLENYSLDTEANSPRHNMIGPVGTLIGFVQMQLLGAAAYLLPVALLWMGIAKLAMAAQFTWRTWTGLGVLLVSGACILGVHPLFFGHWESRYVIVGAGGAIGKGLGYYVFKGLLNTAGSMIVLSAVYLVSLFFLMGVHPVKFMKAIYAFAKEWWSERDERKEARAKKAEKAELDTARKTAATAREKRAKKKQVAEEDEDRVLAKPRSKTEDNGQVTLPLMETPTPQIIDARQRIAPAAGLGAKPFERKKKGHTSLSVEGYEDYELPGFDLLEYEDEEEEVEDNSEELLAMQKTIVDTLKAFGVEVTAGDITRGPTITRYEVYPSIGLRVSRITQLESDLARATRAERINILAPIPGKDTVGIELANDVRMPVALRELLQDDEFRSSKKKIPLALGKDVYGKAVIGDLAAMPHCLVAGATGAGKSVCINSIIASILFKFGPDELRFIMIDPKVVEMQMYADLPHLVVPVVTDPRRVVGALKWCVNEMERRYRIFAKLGVRNFDSFNAREREEEEPEEELELAAAEDENVDPENIESIATALEDGELGPMNTAEEEEEEADDEIPDRFPYIVVIIDELADLMQTAPADVEMCIARIAQKARAAGIHLIVATQTPRADVVTGIIKANIPSRIAFQVSSALDSRVILDSKGAEKLVGKGDMLFLPPGSAKLERSQGAFVSDSEVEALVKFCSTQAEQRFEKSIQDVIESGGDSGSDDGEVNDADEEILQRCMEVVMQEQKASTSLLQRRLRLGYTRAARMIDILEQRGVVGPADGAKAREVYGAAAAE